MNYNDWFKDIEPYSSINDALFKHETNIIKSMLPKNKNISICVVGCGDGSLLHYLRRWGYNNYDASDISSTAIKKLKEYETTKNLYCHDITQPAPLKLYDIVLCIATLEHIKNDMAAVKNLKNMIHQNGSIIIGVPHDKKKFGWPDEAVGHYRRYDYSDILEIAKNTGLHIDKTMFLSQTIFIKVYDGQRVKREKKGQTTDDKTTTTKKKFYTLLYNDILYLLAYLSPSDNKKALNIYCRLKKNG